MPTGIVSLVRQTARGLPRLAAAPIPLNLPWICCSSETAPSPTEAFKGGLVPELLPLCLRTFPARVASTPAFILTPQLPVNDANWLTSLSYREGGPRIDGRQV